MHQHPGQPQHGHHAVGVPLLRGLRGRHAPSQGRSLCRSYTQPVVGVVWARRVQKGVEQPGLLQGPLVSRDREASGSWAGPAGSSFHPQPRGLLGQYTYSGRISATGTIILYLW